MLTQTFASPITQNILKKFIKQFPYIRHVTYDAISYAALDVFENIYGVRALADYDFSKAQTMFQLLLIF